MLFLHFLESRFHYTRERERESIRYAIPVDEGGRGPARAGRVAGFGVLVEQTRERGKLQSQIMSESVIGASA